MAISTIIYNGETSQFSAPSLPIDPTQKTIFLIHGFQSDPNRAFGSPLNADGKTNPDALSTNLQKRYGEQANIINVDWSGVAGTKPLDYSGTAFYTLPNVTSALSNAFKALKIDPTKTEIIGHSLGAHLAGNAAQEFKQDGSPPINQIIGLDPAGVLYEFSGPDVRISPDDAQRVVVIHSSNSLTGGVLDDGLGLFRDDLGALDIYLTKWGHIYGETILDPNDHDLAVDVYKAFVKGLVYTGSYKFASDLPFSDFVDLQKLDNPNFAGEYIISLDIQNATGGDANENLTGDDSNNFLQGNGGNDIISGLGGDDLIYGDDPLYKTSGNDSLRGGAGNDLILGGGGDDTFSGSAGNDSLYGEQGNDSATYFDDFGATQGINVSLIEGWATDSFGNRDTLSGIDNILGSQNNDNIVGDNFNNTLDGFFGNDTLTGLGGADIFPVSPSGRTSSGNSTITTITDFSWEQGDKILIPSGLSPFTVDQFSYNPGDGTLSFQGTPFAILSNRPQDFNVQSDISLSPPIAAPPPFGY
jgi:pimeloyl-ACP methyl ester carboxylesterase